MNESLLVIDKVAGPSSFDVVRQVRRLFGGVKVGHAGSLDPFATGVLVLLLGKATKLSNALLNADKSYLATMKLGESTDSMDRTGLVTETKEIPPLTLEQIGQVLKSYEGEWHQMPPMFSAKKIQGVRLYELARQNISVPREKIPVQLYKVEVLSYEHPLVKFEVHCSKGTYIRSLADDIGKRLGTVAHLHELKRLSCGDFSLEDSVTVEELGKDVNGWRPRGYQNYVKLLSAEGMVRKSPLGVQKAYRHLPSFEKNDNSLLN